MSDKPAKKDDLLKLRRAQLELIREVAGALLQDPKDREAIMQAIIIALSNLG